MVQDTYEILKEIKQSRRFTEGFNTSVDGCRCDRCVISRYRHTSEPELMDLTHTYWDYLAFCCSQVTLNGLWMEFGVGKGSTIDFIAAQSFGRPVYGFDSFEGLPEDWKMSDSLTYHQGRYSLNGSLPPVKSKNVVLNRGMFSDTLPEFLKSTDLSCALVHMDCDLYPSTLYVLQTLHAFKKLVRGTVILFDELYNYQYFQDHEFKAFMEFFSTSGLRYHVIAHTESPVVWNGNQVAVVIV